MDEKTLRDLIARSDRWKNQAMLGQKATITAGEAKLVRQALEWAIKETQQLTEALEVYKNRYREATEEAVKLQAEIDLLTAPETVAPENAPVTSPRPRARKG